MRSRFDEAAQKSPSHADAQERPLSGSRDPGSLGGAPFDLKTLTYPFASTRPKYQRSCRSARATTTSGWPNASATARRAPQHRFGRPWPDGAFGPMVDIDGAVWVPLHLLIVGIESGKRHVSTKQAVSRSYSVMGQYC